MEKKIISITEEMENLNETIKILEKQKLNAKSENRKIKIENLELKEKNEDLKREIEYLKNLNKATEEYNGELKEIHNSRGAGRKKSITDQEIAMMQMLRAQGLTYQAIEQEMGISYSNVYKYCQLNKDKI